MAVTKEIYTLTAGFTPADVIDLLGQAFIDAGLMAAWHDTFTNGGNSYGVLECVYDPTKAFGTTYYLFLAEANNLAVAIGTGWDLATNEFTGTQYLDYFLPASQVFYYGGRSTVLTNPLSYNNNTTLNIYRYTSTASTNQSWFVFQQGLSTTYPFTIISPNQSLYPWLDLDLAMIPGVHNVVTSVAPSTIPCSLSYNLLENIGRAYPYGQGVAGSTGSSYGNGIFHNMNKPMYQYVGTGKVPGAGLNNFGGTGIILPISSSEVNPAFAQDYIPICSELPWTSFSSAPLATDLGVYMHYANNTLNFEDRFVVDPGVEEWEILTCTNNVTVTTAGSPTFLARVV
jgi:hypothetical protein